MTLLFAYFASFRVWVLIKLLQGKDLGISAGQSTGGTQQAVNVFILTSLSGYAFQLHLVSS